MMREGVYFSFHWCLLESLVFLDFGIELPDGFAIAVGACPLFSFLFFFFFLLSSASAFVPHRYPAWRRK